MERFKRFSDFQLHLKVLKTLHKMRFAEKPVYIGAAILVRKNNLQFRVRLSQD